MSLHSSRVFTVSTIESYGQLMVKTQQRNDLSDMCTKPAQYSFSDTLRNLERKNAGSAHAVTTA